MLEEAEVHAGVEEEVEKISEKITEVIKVKEKKDKVLVKLLCLKMNIRSWNYYNHLVLQYEIIIRGVQYISLFLFHKVNCQTLCFKV